MEIRVFMEVIKPELSAIAEVPGASTNERVMTGNYSKTPAHSSYRE
jgi:hypothetical protein